MNGYYRLQLGNIVGKWTFCFQRLLIIFFQEEKSNLTVETSASKEPNLKIERACCCDRHDL